DRPLGWGKSRSPSFVSRAAHPGPGLGRPEPCAGPKRPAPGASATSSAARRSKSFLPKAGAAGCVEAGVTQKARRSMAEERNLSMWGAQRRCLFVFENSLHRIIAYLVGNLFPDGKVLGEGGQGRVALDKPMARY